MKAEEVRSVLYSIGKRPTKRLGQHFLLDERVLERQVQLAEIEKGERVLEIGPGLGNLTEGLLRAGANVIAVEQDHAFCEFLKRRFGERIELIEADAVKAFLPEFDKVVANLPYQISSPITFKLLDMDFSRAVLMLQREFADRMVATAGTGDYGRLSVGVYFKASCEIVMNVSRNSFWPQPRVDSCLVDLRPRKPPFKVLDERIFSDVTRAIFSHRRKLVSNSLATDPAVSDLVSSIHVDALRELPYASKRAEELTPEMIGELSDALTLISRSGS